MNFQCQQLDINDLSQLKKSLGGIGMEILGVFPVENEVGGEPNLLGLMVISAGQSMWRVFRQSREYGDGEPDALDRWSARHLGQISKGYSAELKLPSKRPFAPFQQWAKVAGGLEPSPLSILNHPQYGLWFGLRGALIFEARALDKFDLEIEFPKLDHCLCANCVEKPCLTNCPVEAFSSSGLNVQVCFNHLDRSDTPDCMAYGCMARAACPVGKPYTYEAEQLRFHMRSFRGTKLLDGVSE